MTRKRKDRKKKKYLGQRTMGAGNCKNRRGAGNRGGRGNAGLCKHKMATIANEKNWTGKYHYGKHGFVRHNRKAVPATNLYEINRMAVLGKLEEKSGKHLFEFKGKVLGTGRVTKKLSVKASAWSKKTEEKLKAAGGEIAKLE